jgi:hypothetical protein
VFITFDETTGE